MFKISSTCSINWTRILLSLILNLLELWRFCSFFMLSMNSIAPQLQLDTCLHQESIFILRLQVLLVHYTVLSMEEQTKLYYVCYNQLERNKTFLNSSKMWRTERNCFMDLAIEYTRVTILELKLSRKLLTKCSKSLESKS